MFISVSITNAVPKDVMHPYYGYMIHAPPRGGDFFILFVAMFLIINIILFCDLWILGLTIKIKRGV